MNDQQLALFVAVLIAVLPNILLKFIDKVKSPQEKTKGELEAADLSVDTLTEALKEMREHNKFLEDKLSTKRSEITVQNKMIYDINILNSELAKQNIELSNKLVEITAKLEDCIANNLKGESKC